MRTKGLILALAALGLSAGCAAKKFRVTQAPTEPFKSFGQIEVIPFTIESESNLDEKTRNKAQEMSSEMTAELIGRLKKTGLFAQDGPKAVVRGRLVGFDPGSQALRYFVSFGAGKGEIVAEVTIESDRGAVVSKGFAVGEVTGGWFGGSLKSAARRAARAIAHFVEDNHAAVVSTAESAPR